MREDQHAEMSRGLDEGGGDDGLAGRSRVPEAVAPRGAGIVPSLERGTGVLVHESGVEVVLVLELLGVLLDLDGVTVAAVAVLVGGALRGRDQLGQHSRQRVDLVAAQLCAGRRLGRLRCEHALQPEHEAVPHLPARGRSSLARRSSRPARRRAPRAARSRGRAPSRRLRRVEEGLAEPCLGAHGRRGKLLGRVRRRCRGECGFLHARSTQ